ncbi:MAG: T9SS type A sorting domain-containing protein [Vicingaceae bacterium]
MSSYPNPVLNVLNFDLEENMKYKFILSDINGRDIKQGQLDNELDVSNLNSGIYFLKISTGERFVIKKIIKK